MRCGGCRGGRQGCGAGPASRQPLLQRFSGLACLTVRLPACACPLPTATQNELGVLELIHCLVETLDKWFSNVSRRGAG